MAATFAGKTTAVLAAPSPGVAECTPSNSVALPLPVRAIMCAASGNVTVVYANGYTQQFAVTAGDTIPPVDAEIVQVKATGTDLTASQLLGFIL